MTADTMEEAQEPKNNQGELNGMEGPGVGSVSIPEIDKAATAYAKIRDQRVALTGKEVEAKNKLCTLLHAHEKELGRAPDGALKYRFDDTLITLSPTKEKLRVKTVDDEGGEG